MTSFQDEVVDNKYLINVKDEKVSHADNISPPIYTYFRDIDIIFYISENGQKG